MKGYVFKDDRRFHFVQEYLAEKGVAFAPDLSSPEELDFIVFPFIEEADPGEYGPGFFARLKKSILIFSGVPSRTVAEQCREKGLPYYPVMREESIRIKNAVPTSEGVIAHLIYHRNTTVFGSRILVAGYGLVGSDLAKRLAALGAKTCALVRNEEKASLAFCDGITPVYLRDIGDYTFDVVINTVPGEVFTNTDLERLKGALMVEVASPPYGFSMEYAKALNPGSAVLPKIPGKYAVKYSGDIIGEFIYGKL